VVIPKTGPRNAPALSLGYLMTDAQGRVEGKLAVASRSSGKYIIQVNSAGSDGRVRSINLPVIVRARSGTSR